MPACTACGNHLSTDYLRVFGDNDGALESCPHCAIRWGTAEGNSTTVAPATSADGSGDATSEPPSPNGFDGAEPPRLDRPADSESPRADGSTDAESPDDEEPEFTVKTAGRSLEPPREPGVERSRTERSHPARDPDRNRPSRERDRAPSVLSSVLDVFR